ncbi:hypothetical protein [Nonomuraea sp. NPDC003709]|uniref:hypothetical protein n=1 Tax=Nonomuraea sp. NPDC003709 TaxID=3154450 RepID=UPI0033B65E72
MSRLIEAKLTVQQGDAEGTAVLDVECDGTEHTWAVSFHTTVLGPKWYAGKPATFSIEALGGEVMTKRGDVALAWR